MEYMFMNAIFTVVFELKQLTDIEDDSGYLIVYRLLCYVHEVCCVKKTVLPDNKYD